jgi:hypothetical protein
VAPLKIAQQSNLQSGNTYINKYDIYHELNIWLEADEEYNSGFPTKAATETHLINAFSTLQNHFEQINVFFTLAGLRVWENNDPYQAVGRDNIHHEFRQNFQPPTPINRNNLNLVHLFTGRTENTGRADINGVCNTTTSGDTFHSISAPIVNGIRVRDDPDFFTHEIGHSLGGIHPCQLPNYTGICNPADLNDCGGATFSAPDKTIMCQGVNKSSIWYQPNVNIMQNTLLTQECDIQYECFEKSIIRRTILDGQADKKWHYYVADELEINAEIQYSGNVLTSKPLNLIFKDQLTLGPGFSLAAGRQLSVQRKNVLCKQ